MRSGQELPARFSLADELWSLAISPNGSNLATGGADRLARIWSVDSGHVQHEFPGHGGAVTHVAFSPDSSTLATASFDGQIRLGDIREGAGIEKFQFGYSTGMLAPSRLPIALSPANRQLATTRLDGTVDLWDTSSGELLFSLPGTGDPVVQLALVDDAAVVASLDRAGVFRWRSPGDGGEEVGIEAFKGS